MSVWKKENPYFMATTCWWGIIFLFLTVKSLLVLHSHVYPISHQHSWIWLLSLPQHHFSLSCFLYSTSSPQHLCRLLAAFCARALKHLLVAYSLLKISLPVKFAPASPQKSLGENVACSVINGRIWYIAEAASYDWFFLVRNVCTWTNDHRPDMFHFHSLIHLLIRQESMNVSSAESLSIISTQHSS